jgi:hypothetical protein
MKISLDFGSSFWDDKSKELVLFGSSSSFTKPNCKVERLLNLLRSVKYFKIKIGYRG